MSVASLPATDAAMQLSRLASLQAALRRADPEAQVALDPESGRMKVLSVLPPEQVVELMRALGEPVEPVDDGAEKRTGDGGCGCGCRSGR
jgi:hypothetical protein